MSVRAPPIYLRPVCAGAWSVLGAALALLGGACTKVPAPPPDCAAIDAGPAAPKYPDDAYWPTPLRPAAHVVHAADVMGDLSLRGTDAFYRGAGGAIVRLPLGGGAPEVVAPACGDEHGRLAVDDRTVCCTEAVRGPAETRDRIVCLPRGGGARRVLREGLPSITSFALDAAQVYVGLVGIPGVARIRRSDGQLLTEPAQIPAQVAHICLDGEMVYWNSSGGIFGAPTRPSASGERWQGPISRGPIVVDADSVYWSDGQDEDAAPRDDVIWKRDKARGSFVALASGQYSVHYLGVTEKYVYWRTFSQALRRAPKRGGPTETLGRNMDIRFLAGSGRQIYWEELQGGRHTLFRLADDGEPRDGG